MQAQTVVGSASAVPASASGSPVAYGPGGCTSAGTLPSNPLHLADTLLAVHENDGATGIRRVMDDISTNDSGLGQANAKQPRGNG